MLPTVRQIALSLYASSKRVERMPREKAQFPFAFLPQWPRVAHEVFPLACQLVSDDSQTTETVFAELALTLHS